MILVPLLACFGPSATDGADASDTAQDAQDRTSVEVSRWFASGSPDAVGEPPVLLLQDNGALGIAVDHFGYEAPCTAAVGAEAWSADGTITVDYDHQAPDTYSDTCAWTLTCVLASGTGDFTVTADGDTATVTFEGGA
jgi:hypothetical protein